MMWKRALFMMILVLMLPVAYSIQIQSVNVRGQAGMNNIVALPDTVTFDAIITNVEDADVEILPSLLSFKGYGESFTTCTQEVGLGYVCSYTTPITNQGKTDFHYILEARNRWDQLDDTYSGIYYADIEAPRSVIESVRQDGQEIVVTAKVTDLLSPAGTLGFCSGLKTVSASLEGQQLATVSDFDTSCSQTVQLRFGTSSLGADQQPTICVQATDNFDHSSESCKVVSVDTVVPQTGAIKLVNVEGAPLEFLGAPEQGYFTFSVVEERIGQVYLTVNGDVVSTTCTGLSTGSGTCRSADFLVSDQTYTAVVEVEDQFGNVGSASASFDVRKDETKPILSSITTGITSGTDILVSSKVPIRALLTETESGFSKKRVDLLLPNGQRLPAQRCELSTQWICTWDRVNFAAFDQGDAVLAIVGFDDAGNSITGLEGDNAIATLQIDTKNPVLVDVSVSSFTENTEIDFGYTGAPLIVDVEVEDASPVSGTADFTAVDGGVVLGDCSGSTCTFRSDVLTTLRRGDIVINITDAVGNAIAFTTEGRVLETQEEGSDNFGHDVFIRPGTVNRGSAELLNAYVYAEVVFDARLSGTELVNAELDGCRSDVNGTDLNFLQDYEFLPVGSDLSQFIKFTLKATSYEEVNDLRLECDILVAATRGDKFFPQEVETAEIIIRFFDMPLGDMDEAYEEKLETAIDDATNGIVAKIASFAEFVELAATVCRIFFSIITLLKGIGLALNILDISSDTWLAGIYTYPAGAAQKGVNGGICLGVEGVELGAIEGMVEIASYFCAFITCEFDLMGFLLGEIGEYLDLEEVTGPMLDAKNTLEEFGGLALAGGYQMDSAELDEEVPEKPGVIPGTTNRDQLRNSLGYVEDSLFWSILNLCIPGIIKNLNEYQQIQCRYAKCLRDDVPNGVPVELCESNKSYMTCKYIYGEIFAAIPFVAFLNQIFGMIKQIFASPIALAMFAVSVACIGVHCGGKTVPIIGGWGPGWLCEIYEYARFIGLMIKTISSIISPEFWELDAPEDACEGL